MVPARLLSLVSYLNEGIFSSGWARSESIKNFPFFNDWLHNIIECSVLIKNLGANKQTGWIKIYAWEKLLPKGIVPVISADTAK